MGLKKKKITGDRTGVYTPRNKSLNQSFCFEMCLGMGDVNYKLHKIYNLVPKHCC